MEAGQRFGRYHLFKRLAGDALGESFRAGRIGPQGIERVVLLRVFNGEGLDRDAFWAELGDDPSPASDLTSPYLGAVVDLTVEGGVPYVAYEYIPGKNLVQLIRQAQEKPFPLPVEHALFIVERSALGLAAAYERRFRDERRVHGFLTPGWIRLSSEGEVRLLGVDVAPGLCSLSSELRMAPEMRGFLSPEVIAGERPTSADDVYSLSAILYQLLTGQPLPETDLAAAVDAAVLGTEGEPLAPAMRQLLTRSLAPRPQRITSVDKWRLALSTLIAEGDYSPTTFNLAFFLHTLFRGEIEQETAEIEREQSGDAPTPAPSALETQAVIVPSGEDREISFEEIAERIELGEQEEAAEPGSGPVELQVDGARGRPVAGVARATSDDGKRKKLLIGGLAAAVVVASVAAYLLVGDSFSKGGTEVPAAEIAGSPADATDAAPTVSGQEGAALGSGEETLDDGTGLESGEPAGGPGGDAAVDLVDTSGTEPPPTPEELKARVAQLVAQNVGQMEESLKSEYEARLATLREQLDVARAAAEEEQAAAQMAEPPAQQARTPAAVSPPPEQQAAVPAGGESGTTPPPAVEPPSKSTDSATGSPAETTARQPVEAPAKPPTEPAPTEPPAKPPTEPRPAPKPEPVRAGDLVELGPGVSPPSILRQARPVYPAAARKFAKTAEVKLRVLVDEKGKPAEIDQLSSPARFGFDEAARRAASQTVWTPAKKDGVPVKMWIELTIAFEP